MGLLSRYPFTALHYSNLSRGHGTDLNFRVLLSSVFQFHPLPPSSPSSSSSSSSSFSLSLHLIHWSYDKDQQCQNAVETFSQLHRLSQTRQNLDVILGDFNIYNEWAWPILYLLDGNIDQSNQCTHVLNRHHPKGNDAVIPPPWYSDSSLLMEPFFDAWKTLHPNNDGFTFSTFGDKGLHVRPDRILYRGDHRVKLSSVTLHEESGCGTGSCFWRTVGVRASKVLALFSAKSAHSHDSCGQDCGANAVCHCGVCVLVPNSENSPLPSCPHFHFDVFLIVTLTSLCLFLALLSSSLLFCIFKGSNDNTFYHSKCRRVGISVAFVLLLFAWGMLLFLFASSFSPMVSSFLEIVIHRLNPNELLTSDHVLVTAEFLIR